MSSFHSFLLKPMVKNSQVVSPIVWQEKKQHAEPYLQNSTNPQVNSVLRNLRKRKIMTLHECFHNNHALDLASLVKAPQLTHLVVYLQMNLQQYLLACTLATALLVPWLCTVLVMGSCHHCVCFKIHSTALFLMTIAWIGSNHCLASFNPSLLSHVLSFVFLSSRHVVS